MKHDEEKYRSLRESLKALPGIKAKKDFESRLFKRIEDLEKGIIPALVFKPVKEPLIKNWLSNLLRPSFVPAFGLTVVLLITVVVYFAFFSKMNDTGSVNTEQFTSSTNQGDLIIYVKKESGETTYSDKYPKEYSAVNPTDSETERDAAPIEMPSDYFSRPESPAPVEGYIKPDRVSEEQKIEMQRSLDKDEKGVDVKTERKSDDEVMSKNPGKIMKKKEGKEESPFNIRDEKKNENINDGVFQKEKSESEEEINKPKTGKEKSDTDKTEEGKSKVNRAVKDSTKINKDTKTDQKIEDSNK